MTDALAVDVAYGTKATKGTTTKPRKLHVCYRVMIVTTFLLVVAAATTGALVVTGVVAVPGVSPSPSPSPIPSESPGAPTLRGAAAADRTPAPASGPGAQPPVDKQALGHSGVVKPIANERGTGPMKSWSVFRPLASKPACVDLREFPSEVHARLMTAVRARVAAGDKVVAFADEKACHGAMVARRPASASTTPSFGVPDDERKDLLSSVSGLTASLSTAGSLVVPSALTPGTLSPGTVSLSSASSAHTSGVLSLLGGGRRQLADAGAAAPAQYIWAANFASLSTFFSVVNVDWKAYFGKQCRHTYRDTHTGSKNVEFDFRPNGGRCTVGSGASRAKYYKPCLYHPMVSPASLSACVGPDCASTMQAKSDEMYRSSVSVARFDQPAGTKEAVVRTNVGLGTNAKDKRKVQVAAPLFSTNPDASHCPAAPWTHRAILGGSSIHETADFDNAFRVFALNQDGPGFSGREYVENYPHSFVLDTEVNLVTSLEAEIKAAVRAEQPKANAVGVEVTILDPRSFSVYTSLTLDKDKWYTATKYIQTRTQYQIVHHANTIQVGIFHRSWSWQTSSSVLWFVSDALDDGASSMARQVSSQVSATLAEQLADSLPPGPDGGVVAASTTTLTLGSDGLVFALVAL